MLLSTNQHNHILTMNTKQKAPSRMSQLLIDGRGLMDLSQSSFAKALDLRSAVSVCRWETDMAPVPPMHYSGIARALNIPLSQIIQAIKTDSPEKIQDFHTLNKRLTVKSPAIDRSPGPEISVSQQKKLA